MGKQYSHLLWRERLKIEAWLKAGWSPCKIARELGRHQSTIYREIERGLGTHRTTDLIDEEVYIPDIAQAKYEDTFSGKGPDLKIGHDHEYAKYLGKQLKGGNRSPEAVLGEIEAQGKKFDTKVSPRTLRRYVEMGIIPGVSVKDFPIKSKKKEKKHKEPRKAARACPGKSIEERPQEINDREEPGHWEGDTVESDKGNLDRLFVLTERVTREEIAIKIDNGEAEQIVGVLDALELKLGDMFPVVFKSITVDNGPEFSDRVGMERSARNEEPRTTIYYCHPYRACEKGSTERNNGMIRRKHPKGTNFGEVAGKTIRATVEWINNYPRKMFDFHSSAELFEVAFPGVAKKLKNFSHFT